MSTTRIILDQSGAEAAIVHDGNLALDCYQPAAFSSGRYNVDLQRAEYDTALTPRDRWALLANKIAGNSPKVGAVLTARVSLADAVVQAQSDIDAEQALEAQWPTPTGGQQLLINAAKLKALNSIQAAQDARTALQTAIGALP